MNRYSRRVVCLVAISILFASVTFNATAKGPRSRAETSSAKTVIAPEQAADYLGREVVVEMTVAGANNRNARSPCFLNSKKDYRDKKNFTAIIFPDGLKKFKNAKIDEPAIHFFNKKVRVTGTIELHKEKPQIKVTDPKQIEIIAEPAK